MTQGDDSGAFEPTVIEGGTFGLSQLDQELVSEALRQGLITQVQAEMISESAVQVPGGASSEATVALMVDRGLIPKEKGEELLEAVTQEFVPGYRLGRELGRGAMGVVYEATQKKLGRRVALKVVNPTLSSSADYVRRFKREAQTLAKLNHPNIVQVYDFGDAQGRIFLALEFVAGEDVSGALQREGVLSELKALQIVRDVALGLSHAHHHGVIHRDVKPANLLLLADAKDAEGKDFVTKVTDFGLAREKEPAGGGELTQAGTILGTPAYMAPEQTEGKPACHRCDIYALGATLYHMVTGAVPYADTSVVNILLRKRTERLANPQLLNPELSSQFIRLLDRMIARPADERYQDYAALLTDIDLVLLGQEPLMAPLSEEHSSLQLHALVETAVRERPLPGSARLGTVAALLSQLPAAEPPPPPSSKLPLAAALLGVALLALLGALFALRGDPAPSSSPQASRAQPTPSAAVLLPAGRLGARLGALENLDGSALRGQVATLAELGSAIVTLPEEERDVPAIRLRALVDKALGSDPSSALTALEGAWLAGDYPRLGRLVAERQGLLALVAREPSQEFARYVARAEAAAREGEAERALWAKIEAGWQQDPRDVLGLLGLLREMRRYAEFSPTLAELDARRAELEAAAPEVELTLVPAEAVLTIDGKEQAPGPFKARLVAGKHRIQARAEGYRVLERELEITQRLAEVLYLAPARQRALKIDPSFTTPDQRRRPVLNPRRREFWTQNWRRDTGEWSLLSNSPAGLDGTGSPLGATIATRTGLLEQCFAGLTPANGALGWSLGWWVRPFQGVNPQDLTKELPVSEAHWTEAAAEVRLLASSEGQLAVGYQDGRVYVGFRRADGLYFRHSEPYAAQPPQWFRIDYDHDVAEIYVKDGRESPWRFFHAVRLEGADEDALSLAVLRGRVLFSDMSVPNALVAADGK